jgi:hypothetical protein
MNQDSNVTLNTLLILLVALLQFVLRSAPQSRRVRDLERRLEETEQRLDAIQERLSRD